MFSPPPTAVWMLVIWREVRQPVEHERIDGRTCEVLASMSMCSFRAAATAVRTHPL